MNGRADEPADTAAGAAGGALADLVAVMDRLRSPGGCPWDAEQTHTSLLPYAVEEVFEVVEAVEDGDRAALREELGDLLLQVVFHARVAQEHPTEPFGIEDVAAGIAAKLRARHPHVFGDVVVFGADEVHRNWEAIKKAEKARASALDGIPRGMPALARAEKVAGRARRAGLPVDAVAAAVVAEETAAPAAGSALGRRLLALALEAQAAGVDAEAALRAAVRDLERALRAVEDGPAG
ncbi:MazG family protein [Actinotalea fermentans]|nr:MazG family protein [Actinotalea fermentans]